jgi:hypothetical protein
MNKVAHSLAQEAFWKKQSVVMRYDVPQCVRELVGEERARIANTSPGCNLNMP